MEGAEGSGRRMTGLFRHPERMPHLSRTHCFQGGWVPSPLDKGEAPFSGQRSSQLLGQSVTIM